MDSDLTRVVVGVSAVERDDVVPGSNPVLLHESSLQEPNNFPSNPVNYCPV